MRSHCICFLRTSLIDVTRIRINYKLELWREALEYKDFKLSRIINEYMECNIRQRNLVTITGEEVA